MRPDPEQEDRAGGREDPRDLRRNRGGDRGRASRRQRSTITRQARPTTRRIRFEVERARSRDCAKSGRTKAGTRRWATTAKKKCSTLTCVKLGRVSSIEVVPRDMHRRAKSPVTLRLFWIFSTPRPIVSGSMRNDHDPLLHKRVRRFRRGDTFRLQLAPNREIQQALSRRRLRSPRALRLSPISHSVIFDSSAPPSSLHPATSRPPLFPHFETLHREWPPTISSASRARSSSLPEVVKVSGGW